MVSLQTMPSIYGDTYGRPVAQCRQLDTCSYMDKVL